MKNKDVIIKIIDHIIEVTIMCYEINNFAFPFSQRAIESMTTKVGVSNSFIYSFGVNIYDNLSFAYDGISKLEVLKTIYNLMCLLNIEEFIVKQVTVEDRIFQYMPTRYTQNIENGKNNYFTCAKDKDLNKLIYIKKLLNE